MSEAALASNQNNNMTLLISTTPAGSGKTGELSLQVIRQYGESNVQSSIDNVAATAVSDMVNKLIDDQPMPDFMRDSARQQVSDSLGSFRSDTPAGLDEKVQTVLDNPSRAANTDSASGSGGSAGSGSASDQVADLNSIMSQSMMDEMESASKRSGAEGGGRGNWLAILARSLGATAGEHLKKMVELGEKMGGLDSKEDPEAFAQIQSEFQAESQIFKMFQESIGTMVKSIGEGMSTVARKQ